MQIETTITIAVKDCNGECEYIELPVIVKFTRHKATIGHRDKYGAPEELDEPAYIELDSVRDSNNIEISLTESEEESLIEECWAAITKDYDAY